MKERRGVLHKREVCRDVVRRGEVTLGAGGGEFLLLVVVVVAVVVVVVGGAVDVGGRGVVRWRNLAEWQKKELKIKP